ncbi:MAG TPA: hypothetical protein VNH18_16920 [Bryobacteraceae bacterium]|nr:hypothetical protein [Bryobacteraceae bacterium]
MLGVTLVCGFVFACMAVEIVSDSYDPASGEMRLGLVALSVILHCIEWLL